MSSRQAATGAEGGGAALAARRDAAEDGSAKPLLASAAASASGRASGAAWPRYDTSRCPVCRAPATKWELECPDCKCAAYCSAEHRTEHLAGGHADECEALCTEQLVRWRRAAEGGDAEGMADLGIAYGFGHCRLAKDAAAGASWFKRAADLGNVESQFNLGCLYRDGEGVKQDFAESLRRYRQAAEQGYADAQCAIGNAYYYGRGMPVDFELAVHYYRLAAKGGDAIAMYNLGESYRDGKGVSRSLATARAWLLYAQKLGADALGKALAKVYAASKAAGGGVKQFSLGCAYRDGNGVKQDYLKALRCFDQAATFGHAYAHNEIGRVYYHAWGVPPNFKLALHYFRLGARGGDADCMANLGMFYRDGRVVQRSFDKARTWFWRARRAMESEHKDTAFVDGRLAELYEGGNARGAFPTLADAARNNCLDYGGNEFPEDGSIAIAAEAAKAALWAEDSAAEERSTEAADDTQVNLKMWIPVGGFSIELDLAVALKSATEECTAEADNDTRARTAKCIAWESAREAHLARNLAAAQEKARLEAAAAQRVSCADCKELKPLWAFSSQLQSSELRICHACAVDALVVNAKAEAERNAAATAALAKAAGDAVLREAADRAARYASELEAKADAKLVAAAERAARLASEAAAKDEAKRVAAAAEKIAEAERLASKKAAKDEARLEAAAVKAASKAARLAAAAALLESEPARRAAEALAKAEAVRKAAALVDAERADAEVAAAERKAAAEAADERKAAAGATATRRADKAASKAARKAAETLAAAEAASQAAAGLREAAAAAAVERERWSFE